MTGKIMVSDDDPAVLEVVAEILRDADYTVCTATNIAEAEAVLEKEEIVLSVTDIFMPDGTGLDLARKIKAANASIPVIIMTGTPKSDTVRQSVDIDVDAYLIKPVSAKKLISLVKELL